MGIGFIPLFGDLTEAELKKELEKVTKQRAVATDRAEIIRLDRDIEDLNKELAKR